MNRRKFLAGAVGLGGTRVGLGAVLHTAPDGDGLANRSGGTLRVAVPGGMVDSLDPHHTQGQLSDIIRFTHLFDGLAYYGPDGSIQPGLAQEFESNSAADVWTVKLRPGVRTHEGLQFGADDVIHSVQRMLDPQVPCKGAHLISFVDPHGMTAIDTHTVRFQLRHPYGPFREVWANVYLRMVPKGFDPARPVGTGPFSFVGFSAGQRSEFQRFDGYFGQVPWVDRLVISDINENISAMNALRGGQIDVTCNLPYAQARIVQADSDLRLLNNPTGLYLPICMRTDLAPFSDVRVRQALRLIVDRHQMVRIVLAGFGSVANDIVGRYTACGDPPFAQRAQNLESAKALLAAAGHSDLRLELVTVNGTPGMVECAVVYAEQARAAGVTVNVRVLDAGAFLANYGNWPMAVDFHKDSYLSMVAHSLLPGGAFNATHWNDPEFVQLARAAFEDVDESQRCATIRRMRAIEYERGGNIVWGWANDVNAYRPNVKGLRPYQIDSALYHLNEVWLS